VRICWCRRRCWWIMEEEEGEKERERERERRMESGES
jgi:hypothetical protein